MEKNKMQEQREINYKKWFDRWLKKNDLRKQIMIANNKNYTCLNIPIHKLKDKRDKMMMADDNFINMLRREFIDFEITREKEVKDRYLLGNKIGQTEQDTVCIDWS